MPAAKKGALAAMTWVPIAARLEIYSGLARLAVRIASPVGEPAAGFGLEPIV
jgi:hypothetical protein